MNRELQVERGRRFRRLHESGTFLMPNAWNAGSAALFETAGFEAVGTTSAGIAYSLGRADATGALSIDEALEETARITATISIPVNVDAENGYGESPEAVAECIRRCIDAGAVGAGIEDYTWDPRAPALRPSPCGGTHPRRPRGGRRIGRTVRAHRAGGVLSLREYRTPSPNPSPGRTCTARPAPTCCTPPGVRDRDEIAAPGARDRRPDELRGRQGHGGLHPGGARRARYPTGKHRGIR